MKDMQHSLPYELLHVIDMRARSASAEGLGGGEIGVILRVDGDEVFASMTEVAEIIPPLQLSRVPGSKPWVLGIGNLHGDLLPVFDLAGFVTGVPTPRDERDNRILVVEHDGARCGLLVEAVLGQRAVEKGGVRAAPDVTGKSAAWIVAGWELDGETRPALGLRRLVDSASFHDVAA